MYNVITTGTKTQLTNLFSSSTSLYKLWQLSSMYHPAKIQWVISTSTNDHQWCCKAGKMQWQESLYLDDFDLISCDRNGSHPVITKIRHSKLM